MRDYFAALASRVLQPDRSVQPRPRVPFEGAPSAAADLPDPFEPRESDGVEPIATRRTARRGIAAAAEGRPSLERDDAGEPDSRSNQAARREPTAEVPAPERPDPVAFFVHPTIAPPAPVLTEAGRRGPHKTPQTENPAAGPARRSARTVDLRRRADAVKVTGMPSAAAGADPVIRIHIGRVEVRAMQSPPASPPVRSEEQKRGLMTLDDYVRQRGGERS